MTTKSKQSNTNDVQLLNCPFCNRAVTVYSNCGYGYGWKEEVFRVVCPRCDCYGPSSTKEKNAIALWNTRHDVEIFNTMFGTHNSTLGAKVKL